MSQQKTDIIRAGKQTAISIPKEPQTRKKQPSPHIQQTQTKQGCAYWLFPCWTSWLGTHMFGQAFCSLSACVKGGEYFCWIEPKVNPLCEFVCEKGNKGSGFNKIKLIHVLTGM